MDSDPLPHKKRVEHEGSGMIYGVSVRRIQQLIKQYKEEGEIHVLKKERRPRTYLSEEEKEIIEKVWIETKVGARLLYYELRKRGYKIPLNKIHKYYRETGKSKANPKKQKKGKRCRYERKHSGSLLHGEWYRSEESKEYAIEWLDNASRKILGYGEFEKATAENSIQTLEMAIAHSSEYKIVIRELNTDRGVEFYSNRGGKSPFQKYLKNLGIRHIVSGKTIRRQTAKWRDFC